MVKEFISKSKEQTMEIARDYAKRLSSGDIVLLRGDLGAGKTVFVKGVASYFSNGIDVAVSPTFTIVNVYDTNPKINHFDLYRIESVEELDSIGAEEYLFGEGISFVEWPERASGYFPSTVKNVEILKINKNERLIRISDYE